MWSLVRSFYVVTVHALVYMRIELISNVVASFFNILWDKSNPNREKLLLDIVPGKRDPHAFLEVTTSEECQKAGISPLLKPRTKRNHALISDLSSAGNRRRELATFFTKTASSPGTRDMEQFLSRMDRYGLLWLQTTSARIGKDVPFFRVSYV
eukprot:GHVQ01033597.1.p1 GENE.GHVQ01033597.1~~GHVQ01033597.1.p1  ORF type:complete len:153 (-),score=10.31 GHVQ01033597.1:151-609(-)